jgi:hydrogenase maturation protein HypF
MSTPELPDVIAVGAWLKNAACRLTAGVAHLSPVHGDLGDPRACTALQASVAELRRQSPRAVAAVAHDLHPDFFSTRLAQRLAAELGVPAIGVQHHHAHIAAVLAEHGVQDAVVGLALDGFGLGSDGQAWGGELLWVDGAGWARLGHLGPLLLPGGDTAAREPWRMAASALQALGREAQIVDRFSPAVGPAAARGLQQLLRSGFNCPPSSSAGRWFDAAAGALGLSVRQSHEAEAAIALEQAATRWLAGGREPAQPQPVEASAAGVLDLRPLIAPLFDLPVGAPAPARDEAAAGFHLALALSLAGWAAAAARRCGVATVCLGGGCFANALLTERVTRQLQAQGLRVLRPRQQACGDAALALGQAWVAARQLGAASRSPSIEEKLLCA